MSGKSDLTFIIQREEFFATGRALQRGIGKSLLGTVCMEVRDSALTISSDWGESRLKCHGVGTTRVELTAKAFCALVTTRYREATPKGAMKIVFMKDLKEVAIDRIGVKARFLE